MNIKQSRGLPRRKNIGGTFDFIVGTGSELSGNTQLQGSEMELGIMPNHKRMFVELNNQYLLLIQFRFICRRLAALKKSDEFESACVQDFTIVQLSKVVLRRAL